jgi:hypothetical protein
MASSRDAAWLLASAALVCACWGSAWAAERRVALVVGNGAYKSAPLANPVNDARAMARALQELGFTVLLRENLSQPAFMGALREFGAALKEPDAVGLFYYAGHGMQIKGANYLIPVDAAIEGEDEVKYLSIDANQVLDKMEQAGNRLNIVILDACRDNPFARSFRSKQSGLAQMDAPSGVLIAFATAPGAVALDGEGLNGVYTKHLLRNLSLPGLPVELVLKRVREGVAKETGNKQIPWESSSLLGDFYFKPGAENAMPAVSADSTAVELAFWDSVKSSEAAQEYRAYLEKYPNGQFAALARSRMNSLLAQAPAPKPKATISPPTQVAIAEPSKAALPRSDSIVQVGDSWTYDYLSGRRKVDKVTMTVTESNQDRIVETVARTAFRSEVRTRSFKAGFDPAQQVQETELPGKLFLLELSPYVAEAGIPAPGKSWEDVKGFVTAPGLNSGKGRAVIGFTVRSAGEEIVQVPAGRFATVRVEARSASFVDPGATHVIHMTYWYSPQVRRPVRMSFRIASTHPTQAFEDSLELASYKQSP